MNTNTNTIPPLTPAAVEQLQTLVESAVTIEPAMREWKPSTNAIVDGNGVQ